jgi:N6-L-threonylcarbamoyladenine synthase
LYKLEELKKNSELSEQNKLDLSASLEEAICETLWIKTEQAIKKFHPKEVHLSGGVSANRRLREMFSSKLKNIPLRHSENLKYCTDNAAMIASCAYFCDFKKGFVSAKLG